MAEDSAAATTAAAPGGPDGGRKSGAVVVGTDSGVGASYVGPVGIAILAAVLIVAVTLTIYVLVAAWPTSAASPASSTHVAGFKLVLDREQRLFVIVAASGILGGLIHCLRSLYEYVGERELRRSWLLMYLCLPFIGGALAVVFYVILRGGLITGTAAQVNFFGFASISALVGLFSPEAAEKLKQVFSTVLAPAPTGRDSLSADASQVVHHVSPKSGPIGMPITIHGRGLSRTSAVLFQLARAVPTSASDTEVTVVVPEGAVSGNVRLLVGDLIVNTSVEFRVVS